MIAIIHIIVDFPSPVAIYNNLPLPSLEFKASIQLKS